MAHMPGHLALHPLPCVVEIVAFGLAGDGAADGLAQLCVIWAGAQTIFTPNVHEVESIHRIPVAELLREDAPLLDPGPDAGRPVLRMPIGDDWIAAPTAAILYQFREVCVLGRQTRVAHYDQPAFAWR